MIKKIFFVLTLSQFNLVSSFFCNDRCFNESSFLKPSCFCTDCDKFSDCCSDAFNSNTTNLFHSNQFECTYYNQYHGIYVVSKCNNSIFSEIKSDCEGTKTDLWNSVPLYSKQTSLNYKNIYCALCNIKNLKESEIVFFEVIPSEIEFDDKLNDTYSINVPSGIPEPRSCFKPIDSCPPQSNKDLVFLCSNFTSYRLSKNYRVYKNEFCAKCNEPNETFYCAISGQYIPSSNIILGLQILFDLTNLGKEFNLSYNIKFDDKIIKNNSITIKKEIENNHVKQYMTVIGQSVSIGCLIILLIFYQVKKSSNNIPGKIVKNLTCSLVFSQIFFLTSMYLSKNENIDKPTQIFKSSIELFKNIKLILPCYLIGLFIHYFYLTFFFWTNIMAFDLYQMFTHSLMPIQIYKNQKLYIKYFLYGWFTPLLLIALMLIKNYNKISYGYYECFLSSSIDLLFFFIIPVGLIVSINLILVIIGIRLILKNDNSNEILKKDMEIKIKNKNRIILFLKLFFITGITWILGIVSSLVNNKYSFIWYLYIVLNSLQGVFIMVSFIFNVKSKQSSKKISNGSEFKLSSKHINYINSKKY